MGSAIRDNKKRDTISEFLRDFLKSDPKLSILSAYFTIYAYDKLRKELDNIDQLRFLFGEPSFLKRLDPTKDNQRNFTIEPTTGEIQLGKRLAQNVLAQACYEFRLRSKSGEKNLAVYFRSSYVCKQPMPKNSAKPC